MSAIIVRGIKLPSNEDKLTIHFQKQKNKGGDVDSIIFPLKADQPDAAVVIFDEEETADSVLLVDQIFNGKKLSVKKEHRVFCKCTMTFDHRSLERLLNDDTNIEDIMEEIKQKVPDVHIKNSKSSGLIMSASSWYHVERVKELVQGMHGKVDDAPTAACSTPSSCRKQPDKKVSKSLTSVDSKSSNETVKEEIATPNRVEIKKKMEEENISFIADRDVMTFLLEFKAKEIGEIKRKNHVEMEYKNSSTDSLRITFTQTNDGSSSRCKTAREQLVQLFDKVQNLDHFQHEVTEVKNFQTNFNQNMSLIAAINSAREYYCQVYIGHKSDPHQPTVSFISVYKLQAEYAMKWFVNIFSRFKQLKATPIDVNIYGFIKQTKPMILLTFERDASARIVEVEDEDRFAVILLPQEQVDDIQMQSHVQRFDKMMKDGEKNTVFWNCQLEVGGDMRAEDITDHIELFQIDHKDIFLRRSKRPGSKRVTFTGNNLDILKEAATKLNRVFK